LKSARALVSGPAASVLLIAASVAAAGACAPAVPVEEVFDAAAVAEGKKIFLANGCANCHGEDGSGRGAIGAGFDPPPRDYRDPAAYRNGTDVVAIAATIAAGLPAPGGGMPSFRHLTEERRAALATYIASLQHPDSASVTVRDAWVAETIPGTDSTGAWLTLVNTGPEDAIIAVEAKGVRRARVHAMRHAEGMMTMEALEELALPASADVALEPGGTHLMFERLDDPLRAGDSVEVTLFLRSRTAVRFSAPVRAREGAR